jgi:hypothetical protein
VAENASIAIHAPLPLGVIGGVPMLVAFGPSAIVVQLSLDVEHGFTPMANIAQHQP